MIELFAIGIILFILNIMYSNGILQALAVIVTVIWIALAHSSKPTDSLAAKKPK